MVGFAVGTSNGELCPLLFPTTSKTSTYCTVIHPLDVCLSAMLLLKCRPSPSSTTMSSLRNIVAPLLVLSIGQFQVCSHTIEDMKHLISLSESKTSVGLDPNPDDLNFYGKIVSVCDFPDDECFSAVVASGRTNFYGEGGDLANIYVPANDYDTWRQNIPNNEGSPIVGDFVYQLQNDTLSCLTIELKWSFSTNDMKGKEKLDDSEPIYSCNAVAIASNWDCHLDWSLAAECSFNSTLNQISAIYTVTNLGPEQVTDKSKVVTIEKKGNGNEVVRVVG